MKDLISIIIPVYNRGNFLVRCLDSIVKNNNHAHFEIILVDDGSTDDSGNICDEYASKNYNIRVAHKPNTGVSETRNLGLSMSIGKWVWFIDGDDIPFYGAVDTLYEQTNNCKDDVVIFTYKKFNKDIDLSSKRVKACRQTISKEDAIGTLLDMDYASFPWNKLFSRKLLVDNKIKFPENMSMCEDMEFCFHAYDKAKSFSLISEPLYGYRQDNNSASSSTSNKRYKDAAIANYDLCCYIEQNYPKYFNNIFQNTVISIVAYLHRYNCNDSRYSELSGFISSHKKQCKTLSHRYRIETSAFVYNKLAFNFIGLVGKIARYVKNTKPGELKREK